MSLRHAFNARASLRGANLEGAKPAGRERLKARPDGGRGHERREACGVGLRNATCRPRDNERRGMTAGEAASGNLIGADFEPRHLSDACCRLLEPEQAN